MSGIFCRVWASSPFWDVEHARSGAYDEARGRRIGELLPAKPGRPVLLAESGAVEPHHRDPFKLYPLKGRT